MVNVQGKYALITGASRGVGKQIALCMADLGCHVILHSRELAHTAELKAELEKKSVKVFAVQAELSNQEQVQAMLKEIDSLVPQVDIVFNNAAVMTKYYPEFWTVPAEDYRLSFETNVIAIVNICQHFAPKMMANGFGRLVNTTSGIRQEPELAAYSASKAALTKYVQDIAPRLEGTGVTMNLLDPGWLRTDLGGPQAPNSVESSIPGAVLPALLENGVSGAWFSAQDYTGMSIEKAVEKASMVKNPLLCVPA
ncbi:MAG: SDR family oxidoreductase [Bacteroidales bacterium]|jgi:NAD(P)-dependent dehydrogenase (short-subunit alcohol dehydrogenase family)|nr:SDR family oxidoreductase [Bacteroidales bacterium]